MNKSFSLIANLLVILSMLFPWHTVSAGSVKSEKAQYHARVQWSDAHQRTRLNDLVTRVVTEGEGWAEVLVNEDQIGRLARLGYEPGSIDQIISLDELTDGGSSSLSSIDDDADGLTNTEESWWCTDPLNPDTDSDGRTDGYEIQVLKDWMQNKRASAPGETPWSAWPFNDTTCPDKDKDSIPNLAELELGLNMDLESTDRDRYDDGQELYGVTYCPGSGNACGYGSLPSANHDGILLFPQMPSWVTFPGKHPLVAAFPKLQFDIIPDTSGAVFKIQAATTITTEKVTLEGETKSYSTTKTEGTSTSNAETESFEQFQQYSKTTQVPEQSVINSVSSSPLIINNSTSQKIQLTNNQTSNFYEFKYFGKVDAKYHRERGSGKPGG